MCRISQRLRRSRPLRPVRVAMVCACIAAGMLTAGTAEARQRFRPYGSNFGWAYSSPRTTYYNGPAFGFFGGGRGGNVQYFQRGRSAFWVNTFRDGNGRLRQSTGQLFFFNR